MLDLRRILLAEDDPRDVELTLEALQSHQVVNPVDVVHDGVEVLQYLRREGAYADREPGMPTVVMLDIKMPRMDGLTVLKNIREDPDLKTLPVVILTSSREEKDLFTGYELGANAYVVKPVAFAEFVRAVGGAGLFWAMINETPPTHQER
jgi:CheY-like chemotaxis protein